ncbi:MAG: heme exporter protein CcmD [Comamonadaceae bacterium]|nr:MAG: heme exporter protein CcmD [Comamonadaceae bacterium]
MNLQTLSEFLAMGGYGLYVWGSMGMCGAAVVAEVVLIRLRRRALLREAGDDAQAGPAREHAA